MKKKTTSNNTPFQWNSLAEICACATVMKDNPSGLIFHQRGNGNLDVYLDARLTEEEVKDVLGPDPYLRDGENIETLLSRLPSRTATAIRKAMERAR